MSAAETAYAQALFRAASAGDRLAAVSEDLGRLEPLLRKHERFFCNPGLPADRQVSVLRRCLHGRADGLVVQFLSMLCVRRRLRLLPQIRRRFDVLCADMLGQAEVRLRLPYEPDGALLGVLRDALGRMGLYPENRKDGVRFAVAIDKSLIGGFTAECGGRFVDASLKTRLFRLCPSVLSSS